MAMRPSPSEIYFAKEWWRRMCFYWQDDVAKRHGYNLARIRGSVHILLNRGWVPITDKWIVIFYRLDRGQ